MVLNSNDSRILVVFKHRLTGNTWFLRNSDNAVSTLLVGVKTWFVGVVGRYLISDCIVV